MQDFKQIREREIAGMAIGTAAEYIDFFINLNMGENVSLLSFINNEKRVLKGKLENKINEKKPIKIGIEILEHLILEIDRIGEKAVLEEYREKTQ